MVRLEARWGETPETFFRRSVEAEDKRLRERYLALALVASGRSINQAANEVGRRRQTVGNWIRLYNKNGLEGLALTVGGKRRPRLTDGEFVRLEQVLSRSPENFGFTTTKWRSWQVAQFIEDEFAKTVHPETARRYLKRLAGRGPRSEGKA